MTTTPTNMFGFGARLQVGAVKVSEANRLAASTAPAEGTEEPKPLQPVVTVDAISAPKGKGAPDLTC